MDCPPRHRRLVVTTAAVAAVVLLGAPQWVAAGPGDAGGSAELEPARLGPVHLEPADVTAAPASPAPDPAGGAASAAPSSTSTVVPRPTALEHPPVEPSPVPEPAPESPTEGAGATGTTPTPTEASEEPPVTDPTPGPDAFWPHDVRSPAGDDVSRTGVDPATVTVQVDPAPGATRLVSIRTAAGAPVATVTVTGEPLVFELEEGTFDLFVEHLWDGGGTFLTRTPITTTAGRALTVACDADSLDCTVG